VKDIFTDVLEPLNSFAARQIILNNDDVGRRKEREADLVTARPVKASLARTIHQRLIKRRSARNVTHQFAIRDLSASHYKEVRYDTLTLPHQ
jgi:hypothetical protein